MNCITAEHLTKSFGDLVLFEDISFHINAGDKVALIARNGSGKSTLLSMLVREEGLEGEKAKLLIHKDVRIAYARQSPHLPESVSVLDYILEIDLPKFNAYRSYLEAQFSADEKEIRQVALTMDDTQAWSLKSTISELFHKLQITDLEKELGTLSGGQQKRVALGKAILVEPDMLILDEPTNHLDIEMIEWLEGYLAKPGLTVLMVTHDRYFLDRICTRIIEIHRKKMFTYRGGYSDYIMKKSAHQEQFTTTIERTRKLLNKEMEWLNRMPKARGTKAKARIHSIHNMQAVAAQKIYEEPLNLTVNMTRLGSKILELYNLNKRYGDLILIRDLDYKFKKGDRIGLVGPNGVGKSTLLKLMTKAIRPETGKVVLGDTVKFGVYEQGGLQLEKDLRIIDIIRNIAEYLPLKGGQKLTAEKLLERFLFSRAKHTVYYSQLSGGEKRRIYLLTVLMANPNFLILDEPTNDLDILTLNILEEFLLNFQGCLVIVSHDRYMLDKLVDHLFVFEGQGKVKDFPGNYSTYREYLLGLQKPEVLDKGMETPSAGKAMFEARKKLKRIEKAIEKLENEKVRIHARFSSEELPLKELQDLDERLKTIIVEIEEKEETWEIMVEQLEENEGN